MVKYKEIKCKICETDCKSGNKGLCINCYDLEQLAKKQISQKKLLESKKVNAVKSTTKPIIDLEKLKGNVKPFTPTNTRVKNQEELDLIKKKKAADKLAKSKEKAKVKREAQKYSKSTLMSVADQVFSLFIRLRDSDKKGWLVCCSSNRLTEWKGTDCGHYISRTYMKYRYDIRNCHSQSKVDNVRKHGNVTEYRRFIIKTYGKEIEEDMFEGSKEEFHTTSEFFLDIITKYIPIVKKQLLTKTFDCTNYIIKIKKFESLYCK